MFASTQGMSHYGNFTLEKVKKGHAIYQYNLTDKDGDAGMGHFKVNRRGIVSFYSEEGTDDSKLTKDDPLLFRSDAGDAFSWGSITGPISDAVDQIGHYGTIAAKGLDTGISIYDSLKDFGKSTGLFRRSDDLSAGDVLSGVKEGISIAGSLINTISPILPFLL